MLKINKNEMINEDLIECICEFETEPVRRLAAKARAENRERDFIGRGGLKSAIFMNDGYIFACPFSPGTYGNKLENPEQFLFADPKRLILNRRLIREIASQPNAGQKREIAQKKKDGLFIDLTRRKKTGFYVFMTTGTIYGIRTIRETA